MSNAWYYLLQNDLKGEIKDAKWAVFRHQMKHWEESWKYNMQQSIFDELQGVPDKTLCRMLDITSNKMI